MSEPRWRSMEERARAALHGIAAPEPEFPDDGAAQDAALSRRGFLGLMGASLALAGETGCARTPAEKIVPYAAQPPEVTPGIPRFYATALTMQGYATGVLLESHEGRPTKVEGNPDHPASLGAAGARELASVLSLYDPDRAKFITRRGEASTYRAFVDALSGDGEALRTGNGLHVVMEPTGSPLHADLIAATRVRLPGVRFHFHSATPRDAVWHGTALALGRPLDPQPDLRAADVVLALDSDFLAGEPFSLRYAREFADRRRLRASADGMNRLYAAECALTVTGAAADHRLRLRRRDMAALVYALLAEVLRAGPPAAAGARAPDGVELPQGVERRWVEAVARDLVAHPGRAVVVAGEGQPAEVHAAAALLNAALGAPVSYVEPAIYEAGGASHGLADLCAELDAGRVEALVVLACNVAYSAPGELRFAERMRRARTCAYVGAYEDETARCCEWFVPEAHALESWGDARAYDGTVSFVQPLVQPLYGGRSCIEVLGVLAGRAEQEGRALVRAFWQARAAAGDFEPFWERSLERGVVEGTASPRVEVAPRWAEALAAAARRATESAQPARGIELSFREDAKVFDGRFANNAWLQELPDPITKLTWDNAAMLAPDTAARHGLSTGDVVELRANGRSVRAAVMVVPGHADDAVTLPLGYGRDGAEHLARGVGTNAYALRRAGALGFDQGLALVKTDDTHELAVTQEHWTLQGRDPVPEATLAQYRREPRFVAEKNEDGETLYHLPLAGENQWAMSIDLAVCTGCSACVVACQAENNVPVVGREGVKMSREMHWLRVDRYFTGEAHDPKVSVQPMLCQHCEQAPCEYVCPVNATVHSPDGLNEQVYNRCVGTRFCSNNCPYKVRRFNWFNYHRDQQPSESLVMNPDVTVRARGVMEKCTYCVQRIREAEIVARREIRRVRDGEVHTACQQACPTGAIVFGSIADPGSEVGRLRRNERTYAVLNELGTRPRTRYLARVRNPNPELEAP